MDDFVNTHNKKIRYPYWQDILQSFLQTCLKIFIIMFTNIPDMNGEPYLFVYILNDGFEEFHCR